MPYGKCETHGPTFFFESCEHVSRKVKSGEESDLKFIWDPLHRVLVCKTCIEQYHLSKYLIGEGDNDAAVFDSNPFAEGADQKGSYWYEFIEWYENVDTKRIMWCHNCYDDLLNSLA